MSAEDSTTGAPAPAPAPAHGPPAQVAALAVSVLACCALVVVTIWCVPYIPMNDGPQHLFGAWASQHIDDPAAGLAGLLVANRPVTSNGYAQVFHAFGLALGWQDAHRATLTTLALFWSFGFLALARAIDERRSFVGLLGFASALSWSFYIGLLPFLFATALGFFVAAFAIRQGPTPRPIDRAALATLLAVQATVHAFSAFVTGLVLLALSLWRRPLREPSSSIRELLALGLSALPAAAIALQSFSGGEGTESQWLWRSLLERVEAIGVCFVGGPAWRAWPIVGLALLGCLSFIGRGEARGPEEHALLASALALVALSFVIPETAGGWQLASTRTLSMGVLAGALLLPLERVAPQPRLALQALLVVVALSSLGWSVALHRRAAAAFADVIDALDAPVHASGLRMPLVLVDAPVDARIPHSEPLRSIGPLFAVAHGGVPTNAFAGVAAVDQVLWTDEATLPPIPSEPYMTRLLSAGRDELLSFAVDVARQYAGGVVAIEPAELHERWLQRGWVADHQDRRVLVAHFVGCAMTVTPPPGSASVESGLWPARADGLVRRSPVSGDAPRALGGLGCGELWLRFRGAGGVVLPCSGAALTRAKLPRGEDGVRVTCASTVTAPE